MTSTFYILSLFIGFVGLIIIAAFLSSIKAAKRLKQVNDLITGFSLEETPKSVRKTYVIIKRLIDIVFSLISLGILFPTLFIIILMIKVINKGSVFVKIKTIGVGGGNFSAYKFRTKFINESEQNVANFTPLGLFLYKSSLDELPKLINVLKGDMSLVGTSPYYEKDFSRLPETVRQTIASNKPGIVSLWAVSGDKQRFNSNSKPYFDIYYLNKRSLTLDLYILLSTIGLVFSTIADY